MAIGTALVMGTVWGMSKLLPGFDVIKIKQIS